MRIFKKQLCRRASNVAAVAALAAATTKRVAAPPANKAVLTWMTCGVLSLVLGCLGLIYPPSDVLWNERLRMHKGLPAYDWWATPPEEVYAKVHVFNVTNSEEFLNGSHSKLRFQEVGPYIFKEISVHKNIVKHDNGTLSYTRVYDPVFMPELNTLSLNDTIVVPNLALLGMASYLADSSFVLRLGFNLMMRRLGSQAFTRISVYNYMWNMTDPMLITGYKLAPFMVPINNVGVLNMIYSSLVDNITVFIGTDNERRFFTMDRFNGRQRLGYWNNETCDTVERATEGMMYHQAVERTDQLHFFRKTLCRIMLITYSEDLIKDGIPSYNFTAPVDTFHRPKNHESDCFTLPGNKPHPDGISEIGPCFYDLPLTISFPHFLGVDEKILNTVEGLTPDYEKHSSYAIVEPRSGVPLSSRARMQGNLFVKDVRSFGQLSPFANTYLPLFWIELAQMGVPWYMYAAIYFGVVVIPATQGVVCVALVVLGFALLGVSVARMRRFVHKYVSLNQVPKGES